MGDETTQFASRFAAAVSELALLAHEGPHARTPRTKDATLGARVRDALDAVAAVFETGTNAVRNWPEQRRCVLEQIAAMRAALDGAGGDDQLRRMARELVELIELGSAHR
jgi:hypothetical protein